MKLTKLFQQDDCASDSLDYFESKLYEEVGVSLSSFKDQGEFTCGLNFMDWVLDGYVLSISTDDPFYILSKEILNDFQ
tara:strand:- start:476 stop:709 length:234 start_codon:yes stop_codon:yes gene_type:complete